MKLLSDDVKQGDFELYNLAEDPSESHDLAAEMPEVVNTMREPLLRWNASVEASVQGKDYPEGRVDPNEPTPRFWMEVEAYRPYFDDWRKRWEYRSRLSKVPTK